jgi:hypothetical protein
VFLLSGLKSFRFQEFQVSGVSAIAHPLPPKGDLPYVFTFFVKVGIIDKK